MSPSIPDGRPVRSAARLGPWRVVILREWQESWRVSHPWPLARRKTVLPSTVLVSLLLGMLLVVGVTAGGMLFFSNLVVQRQISRLPPDLREQFHEHALASPGASPALSSDPVVRGGSLPIKAPGLPPLIGPVLPPGPILHQAGRHSANRARNFLRDVGVSLQAASVVSALFGLLLAVLMARRIARPIGLVSEAAKRLAAGDLQARAPVLAGDRETTDLARNFNAMAQGLEQLEQERRDTVAAIAHELRTPLTVMQARLDAMEDGIYPLDQEQVTRLSDQTQFLTRLVGHLRTLSLAEAGRLSLHLGPVSPLQLARSVAQDIGGAHTGRGISVEVQGEDATLQADLDRVRQVLINLTENAFKHATSRVNLTVEPGQPGSGPRVHVDDDGAGIPENERERVFEQFVRLEDSRSRDSGGSGLGLAVVQALMGAHGGQARMALSPLGGTRVTLVFPPVDGQRELVSTAGPRPSPPTGS